MEEKIREEILEKILTKSTSESDGILQKIVEETPVFKFISLKEESTNDYNNSDEWENRS